MTVHYRDSKATAHKKTISNPDANHMAHIEDMAVLMSEWLVHPTTRRRAGGGLMASDSGMLLIPAQASRNGAGRPKPDDLALFHRNPWLKGSLALFQRLKGYVQDEQHADWYTEAEECFGFVAGRGAGSSRGQRPVARDSWQEMLDSGRQPIEFNRVGPIVDAICGLEINNRQEIKYLPRTQGDVAVNERLSSLGEWARDEANAEDEESEMFRNAVICGRGATETRIDFSEEPTGKIVVDCLDPMECGVDPGARKQALSDRRYSWRFRDMPTDEAKGMFDGVESVALNATWAGKITTDRRRQGNKTDYPDETRAGLKDTTKPKTVRIVQIEWWERRAPTSSPFPARRAAGDQPGRLDLLQEQTAKLPPEEQPAEPEDRKARYRKAFLGKNGVLDQSEISLLPDQLDDRALRSQPRLPLRRRAPDARSADAQQQDAEPGSPHPEHQRQGRAHHREGRVRQSERCREGLEQPRQDDHRQRRRDGQDQGPHQPANAAALVQLQEFSLSSIRDVTGASVEMLGLADRDQPASLEYQRRQSAMTILAACSTGCGTIASSRARRCSSS
jgi:hypothetical protein